MPVNQQKPFIPPVPLVDLGMPPAVVIEPPATDELGRRLAWAGALAALIMGAALEIYLILLVVPLGWAGLVWLLVAALAATGIALAWVAHYVRLAWRREAFVSAASEDAINDRLDWFKAWGAVVLDTQSGYNARYYRAGTSRRRLLKVTNGAQEYYIDPKDNTVWRVAGRRGDNSTPDPARYTSPDVSRETSQDGAPTAHLWPELDADQAQFLALIIQGKAFGARAVIGKTLGRLEYDRVTSAFVRAGIIYSQPGKTFALPPALAEWRSAWLGGNDTYRAQIAQRADQWARRLLAGQLED